MSWSALDDRQRRVLACTLSASALVFFDQTAVTVALPDIGDDFGAYGADLQWVISAYLLALAVFMLVAGRVADRFGLRRTFLTGLAIFLVGSLCCAAAPNLGWLIGARFLQGIGGAIVQPLALGITTRASGEALRGWAIGVLATGGTSFLVFGPLVAGVLLISSWRWIFVVSVPVVLFAILIGRRSILSSREAAPRPISWLSVALLAFGLAAVLFSTVSAAALAWWVFVPFACGVAALAVFVRLQLRAPYPLLDVGLLRNAMLATSLAALFAIQFAVFGVMVYLALDLRHRLGLSGLAAGAVIAIAGAATPLLSVKAGGFADRHGPRRLVLPGLLVASAGLVLLGVLAPTDGVIVLLPGLITFAMGRPGVFTPAGTGPFLALGPDQRAFAASLATEARQLGAALGVAMTTAVGIAVGGGSVVRGAPLLGHGLRAATLVAAAVCALAAFAVWRWMPTGKRADETASR